jgi:hypothetical protein
VGQGLSDIARLHRRLHEEAASLFRALDQQETLVYVPFSRFLDAVDMHVRTDLTIGYRLFLHHPSESVRRIAERVLQDQQGFPEAFEAFLQRWGSAGEEQLRSPSFRDELETLVSALLKRIRLEERLLSMLSHVA